MDPVPSTTAPTRRWYQFGLGTLLVVVTAIAVVLGWELNIVRERKRLWQRINNDGGYTLTDSGIVDVPFLRKALGDKPRQIIALPSETFSEEDAFAVRVAFPEATVIRDAQRSIRRQGDEDEN